MYNRCNSFFENTRQCFVGKEKSWSLNRDIKQKMWKIKAREREQKTLIVCAIYRNLIDDFLFSNSALLNLLPRKEKREFINYTVGNNMYKQTLLISERERERERIEKYAQNAWSITSMQLAKLNTSFNLAPPRVWKKEWLWQGKLRNEK